MCGRFSLKTTGAALQTQFQLPDTPAIEPRYNIAPTQQIAVVQQTENGPALQFLRWGLVPAWARDPAIGSKMINARAETVAEKPAFRQSFKTRRCLVLADGFYEWQAAARGGRKQPFYFALQDERPFALAGLWEHWEGKNGTDGPLDTCTIITTEANELLRPVHERMPVMLHPEDYALWLDPAMKQPEPLQALLRPYPPEAMISYPIGYAVNDVRNDSPECIAPLSSTR